MKRFTSLLLSLLSVWGLTANAQTGTPPVKVSDEPTGGTWAENTTWYYISNAKGAYVSSSSSKADGLFMADQLTKPETDAGKWCVVGDGTSGYKFYNKEAGVTKIIGFTTTDAEDKDSRSKMVEAAAAGDFATTFVLTEASYLTTKTGYWLIKWNDATNTNWYWTQHGANEGYLSFWKSDMALYGWQGTAEKPTGGDEGSSFKFEEIEETPTPPTPGETGHSVTYVYKIDGKEYARKTVKAEDGSAVSVPELDNAYVTVGEADKTDAITGDCEVNVTCTVGKLPFEVSADFATATWYNVQMKKSMAGGRMLWNANTDGKSVSVTARPAKSVDGELGDNYLWCVMGDFVDGYKLYNKAAGEGLSLRRASLDNDGLAALSDGTDNNMFRLTSCKDEENGGAASFYVHAAGETAQPVYLNYRDANGGGVIKGWTDADAGSGVSFLNPGTVKALMVFGYAQDYASYETPTPAEDVPEGGIVASNAYLDDPQNKSAFLNAYTQAIFSGGSDMEKIAALVEQNKQVAAGVSDGVDLNAVYRIQCVKPKMGSDHTMMTYDSNAVTEYAACVVPTKADAGCLWKFVKSGDYYLLKNLNTGKYLENIKNASNKRLMIVDEAEAGQLFLNQYADAPGHYEIRGSGYDGTKNYSLWAEDNGGADDNYRLAVWEEGSNSASAWFIIKATDLEVPLTAIGDGAYASVYLPVGVKAGEGAKLYTGKLNDTGDKLKMMPQSVLPMETGAVIMGGADAEKATLMLTDETAVIEGNALMGSLLPMDDPSTFLLFGETDGKPGFMAPGAAKAAFNKAYLAKTGETADVVMADFGNDPSTGIGALTATDGAADNQPVYDLSGRRVLSPEKGGLYIRGGKKLLVK